jgi:ubiquinone/menaquinone biosynthesis C-methylase UbiE
MNSEAQNSKSDTSNVYSGWLELYQAGSEGVPVWSEAPPPFLEKLKPFVPPGTLTIETCCGDGRITEALVNWGAQVTAVDLSPEALKQLNANFCRRGIRPPLTVIGSACEVPLGDAQFDAAVCVNGFCQLHRPVLAMQEIARLLRPKGRFLLDIFTPSDSTFGQGEQIGAQDYLYRGTLFRYFTAQQFVGIYNKIFRVVEMFESTWRDPAHGEFRPTPHDHTALIYVLEKL